MSIRDYKLNIRINKNAFALISMAVIFTVLWILVSFTFAFFTAFLLACLIWRVEVKYPLYAALALICLGSVVLALGQSGAGNLVVNWGFFFFAIGVILALLRLFKKPLED